MPIQLPDLDNKTFDDLMKEMLASIPKYTKEWTNFNPSDPGITLLEFLAWVAEALIYRANRIPDESYVNFLRLIAGPEGNAYDRNDRAYAEFAAYVDDIVKGIRKADVPSMKAEAQRFLNSRYRAITTDDFTELALEARPEIRRVVVSTVDESVEITLIPHYDELRSAAVYEEDVTEYLKPRVLVGTAFSVRVGRYTSVSLEMTIVCKSYAHSGAEGGSSEDPGVWASTAYKSTKDITGEAVQDIVAQRIFTYLDSLTGGPDGKGWPYGRTLTVYELFHLVEGVEGIEYVEQILANGKEFKEIRVAGVINLKSLKIDIKGEDNG